MLNEWTEKVKEWWSAQNAVLQEQDWYQQINGIWEGLEPKYQYATKIGLVGVVAVLVLGLFFNALISIQSIQSEVEEKTSLVNYLRSANQELKMSGQSQTGAVTAEEPTNYVRGIASSASIDSASLQIENQAKGTSSKVSDEALLDVVLQKVSIRQVVDYVYRLETGVQPLKVRRLEIDTKNDQPGYLNARISVSAYSLKETE